MYGPIATMGSLRSSPHEVDDLVLVRAQQGDAAACRALVLAHQRRVLGQLRAMLGPVGRGALVEDLAQETFLRAFRALPSFDPNGPARVSTWLLTIATRLALDSKRRTRPEPASTEPEVETTSPERAAMHHELREAIAAALEGLSDDQRAAFVLAEFHGFSLKEIEAALDVPVATLKTRLFRAREKLARALESFEEER